MLTVKIHIYVGYGINNNRFVLTLRMLHYLGLPTYYSISSWMQTLQLLL